MQIAFALGNLSENFVVEKRLIGDLIRDNFTSIGLEDYGVEIHIDDLSKKEILSYIDEVNFNTKRFLEQDYHNFKKYISAARYPQHVDYLNNDYAPDLLKFLQSKIGGKKTASYYGFLKAIGESDLPSFSERQEAFIKYVSEMLPIVRSYEYLIIKELLEHAGSCAKADIEKQLLINIPEYDWNAFNHALRFMNKTGFFIDEDDELSLKGIDLDIEFTEYIQDLLEYGLGKYDVDFHDKVPNEPFKLWAKYRKEQVQQLLLNNPKDIMLGTKNYNGIVYIYVTIVKSKGTKDDLKYVDGYLDTNTFRWETVAHISDKELNGLKNSKMAYVFVRKVENEDGIQLPFSYIGSGKMEYIEGSRKTNGAHLFRIPMNSPAPEDLYFDYKLREQ